MRLSFYFSKWFFAFAMSYYLTFHDTEDDFYYLYLNLIIFAYKIPNSFMKNFASTNDQTNLVGIFWIGMVALIFTIILSVEISVHEHSGDFFE